MGTLSTKSIGENGRGFLNIQTFDNIYRWAPTTKTPKPLFVSRPIATVVDSENTPPPLLNRWIILYCTRQVPLLQ